LSQRQQAKQTERAKAAEKRVLGVAVNNASEVEEFAQSQPYVTPYLIAERFGIRLSIAKGILKGLAERGLVRPLEGVTGLKLYVPTREVRITPHKPLTAKAVEGDVEAGVAAASKKAKGKAAKARRK